MEDNLKRESAFDGRPKPNGFLQDRLRLFPEEKKLNISSYDTYMFYIKERICKKPKTNIKVNKLVRNFALF